MKKDPQHKPTAPSANRNALIAQARRTDLLAINAVVRAGQETVDRDALFASLQALQENTRALLRALEAQTEATDPAKLESVA